jgi:hypothetical protein
VLSRTGRPRRRRSRSPRWWKCTPFPNRAGPFPADFRRRRVSCPAGFLHAPRGRGGVGAGQRVVVGRGRSCSWSPCPRRAQSRSRDDRAGCLRVWCRLFHALPMRIAVCRTRHRAKKSWAACLPGDEVSNESGQLQVLRRCYIASRRSSGIVSAVMVWNAVVSSGVSRQALGQ